MSATRDVDNPRRFLDPTVIARTSRLDLRAQQVVTCELRTLACEPVSPVIPVEPQTSDGSPSFLVEGSAQQL